jgi:hypothetical protein
MSAHPAKALDKAAQAWKIHHLKPYSSFGYSMEKYSEMAGTPPASKKAIRTRYIDDDPGCE